MRVLGFESHFPKLAERMRRAALYPANTVPTAPMYSFQNVVVNNEADLWIITRLALANDELGAIIGRCRMVSMQAESRLSTNPVLLHKPTPNTASETVARFRSVADPACSRVQRGQTANRWPLGRAKLSAKSADGADSLCSARNCTTCGQCRCPVRILGSK